MKVCFICRSVTRFTNEVKISWKVYSPVGVTRFTDEGKILGKVYGSVGESPDLPIRGESHASLLHL